MIQRDRVDAEMLPNDWKRTGHIIQTCDFFEKKVFFLGLVYNQGMEIIFTNNAKDRSVYRYKKDFERILERACKVLDRKGDWNLSVIYVTPEQIHEINRDYRNVDRPTDVISFAIQDDMSDMWIEEDQYELGDIFINVQAIRDQAKAYGHSIRREACFFSVMDYFI